jgi:hypothetical protein
MPKVIMPKPKSRADAPIGEHKKALAELYARTVDELWRVI